MLRLSEQESVYQQCASELTLLACQAEGEERETWYSLDCMYFCGNREDNGAGIVCGSTVTLRRC